LYDITKALLSYAEKRFSTYPPGEGDKRAIMQVIIKREWLAPFHALDKPGKYLHSLSLSLVFGVLFLLVQDR